MASLSVNNFHKPRPRWFVKLQKIQATSTVGAVALIKGLWRGDPHTLDQVLLVVVTGLPTALEGLGSLMADEDDTAVSVNAPQQ